jgi:hypothetical protein
VAPPADPAFECGRLGSNVMKFVANFAQQFIDAPNQDLVGIMFI